MCEKIITFGWENYIDVWENYIHTSEKIISMCEKIISIPHFFRTQQWVLHFIAECPLFFWRCLRMASLHFCQQELWTVHRSLARLAPWFPVVLRARQPLSFFQSSQSGCCLPIPKVEHVPHQPYLSRWMALKAPPQPEWASPWSRRIHVVVSCPLK